MNRREASIITAYTGMLIGLPSDFHRYAEEKFGRPIMNIEMTESDFWNRIKKLSKDDFIELHYGLTEN